MLIGIDSSPRSLSLRNRSTLCSTTKCHQNKSDLKNVFVQKSFFFNIFYSFNPNHAYWNQRRLFSGNLPGMFLISIISQLSWTNDKISHHYRSNFQCSRLLVVFHRNLIVSNIMYIVKYKKIIYTDCVMFLRQILSTKLNCEVRL